LYKLKISLIDEIVVVAESRGEAWVVAVDEADDFIADSTSRPVVGEAIHVTSECQLPIGWHSGSRPYSGHGGADDATVAEVLASTRVDERQLSLFAAEVEVVGEDHGQERNAPGLRPGAGEEKRG
jgi:hypothetical protein